MKLLVFAHVPPPHHGQSQMVQHLVEGLRARPELGVEVFHVDARLSDDLQDVGSARGGKLFHLLRYCARAVWLRWRHGVRTLYYVPSPPKRNSLYRDWIVCALLRPWFGQVVFHWHSAGLGEWLEREARTWERWLTQRLLGRPALSIVLAETNRSDGEWFRSRETRVVPNGIPDPCPDYAIALAPIRRERLGQCQTGAGEIRVLFLALCSHDKGLFDAVEAIALANAGEAAAGRGRIFRLTVAGAFPDTATELEFRARCTRPDVGETVEHVGFLSGPAKLAAWRDADLFLFPTYYANEAQPVSLIEAMAFGVPAVTTRWRGIPELLPAGYPGLVAPRDPAAAAAALVRVADSDEGHALRAAYEARFLLSRHLEGMAAALRSCEG